jgi:hypothetical protein
VADVTLVRHESFPFFPKFFQQIKTDLETKFDRNAQMMALLSFSKNYG